MSGIGSTSGQANAFAATPTTSIAAAGTDEVSVAIAALFGSHGEEFQALTARAAAFHNEFVGLVKSGVGAYLSSEVATPGRCWEVWRGAPAQAISQSAAGLEGRLEAFGAAVAAPYQDPVLEYRSQPAVLGSTISADPHPLLQQVISNQVGYAQKIGTGFVHAIENIPNELANVPGNIENGLRALSSVKPEALAQHFISDQIGYGQTISTGLGSAAHDFTTGLHGLPASFHTAFSDLEAGNATGTVQAVKLGLQDLFITGFNTSLGANNVITVTPAGTLGDLMPILSIPGQIAQNATNLLPASSIPGHVAQYFTNALKTVTDLNLTSTVSFVSSFGGAIDIDATAGLPLVLAIDLLGGPINAVNAFGHSATTFVSAFQSGNALGAAEAVLDAPAAMANGFLNGQMTLPLSIEALGLPTTLNVPLDGILVPASMYTATVPALGGAFPGLRHWYAHRRPAFRHPDHRAQGPGGCTGWPAAAGHPDASLIRIRLQHNTNKQPSATFGQLPSKGLLKVRDDLAAGALCPAGGSGRGDECVWGMAIFGPRGEGAGVTQPTGVGLTLVAKRVEARRLHQGGRHAA